MMNKNKQSEVMRMLHTASQLQVRESSKGESPSRTITGYAILFDVASSPLWIDEDSEGREIIDSGAITKELLDKCDIKMTMFHDSQLILARSKAGEGTLAYNVDEKGVSFEFDAPNTVDGDKALELVRRGDIAGCSFAFSTKYWDEAFVSRTTNVVGDITLITYRVNVITGIYDFTLAADPAYSDTTVEAEQRELIASLREPERPSEKIIGQIREMREMCDIKTMLNF